MQDDMYNDDELERKLEKAYQMAQAEERASGQVVMSYLALEVMQVIAGLYAVWLIYSARRLMIQPQSHADVLEEKQKRRRWRLNKNLWASLGLACLLGGVVGATRWYYKYLQLEIPAHVKSPYAATIETFDKLQLVADGFISTVGVMSVALGVVCAYWYDKRHIIDMNLGAVSIGYMFSLAVLYSALTLSSAALVEMQQSASPTVLESAMAAGGTADEADSLQPSSDDFMQPGVVLHGYLRWFAYPCLVVPLLTSLYKMDSMKGAQALLIGTFCALVHELLLQTPYVFPHKEMWVRVSITFAVLAFAQAATPSPLSAWNQMMEAKQTKKRTRFEAAQSDRTDKLIADLAREAKQLNGDDASAPLATELKQSNVDKASSGVGATSASSSGNGSVRKRGHKASGKS